MSLLISFSSLPMHSRLPSLLLLLLFSITVIAEHKRLCTQAMDTLVRADAFGHTNDNRLQSAVDAKCVEILKRRCDTLKVGDCGGNRLCAGIQYHHRIMV